MKNTLIICLFLCATFVAFSQRISPLSRPSDSLKTEPFINTIEQSMKFFYADYLKQSNYDSIISALKYEPKDLPTFSDEVYCQRLEEMSQRTPFHMDCNPTTLSTLKFFVDQRRQFTRIILGRAPLYFDLFKDKLAEYGLPIELRFLAVIESGLRPQIKSKAGALGLWQFMYKTGLYFGLEENSYVDERMDPDKATDAACRYLKQLYGIYGDWNLALAAYNAGPGNVNKAIVRSGNKKTYWEVRPFLPKETQGYVPNFIAAAYMLTYHAEHNIIPMEAKTHNAQLDTICLKKGVHMESVALLANWDLSEIKEFNPIYKTTFIPKSEKGRCLSGPLDKIYLVIHLEDSLYAIEKQKYGRYVAPIPPPKVLDTLIKKDSIKNIVPINEYQYYTVKAGDKINVIAQTYKVTIDELTEWNKLSSPNLYVGQSITIKKAAAPAPKPVVPPKPVVTPKPPKPTPPPPPQKKYYSVKSGDNFSQVARKNNLTFEELKKLNPGINVNTVYIGQKLRIK